jgi:hypothetical protein
VRIYVYPRRCRRTARSTKGRTGPFFIEWVLDFFGTRSREKYFESGKNKMSRFRPTSFRVAFGNTSEPEPETKALQQEPNYLPQVTSSIDIQPVRVTSIADTEFEQIVVRETPCRQCNCYHCAYRQRMHEHKLNLILLILIILLIVLVVHVSSKSA